MGCRISIDKQVWLGGGGRPKKNQEKVQKVGVFLAAKKIDAKTPHPPHKTPQLHHQNTTRKRRFSGKTPEKTPLNHTRKKSSTKMKI
ncbi:hypothetical protein [Tunturibacter empetritectus]|uniref:Uncharacterized protein n=1 Tax=Tunturiibacter lichenicola TaxID=2051959 RepID=A0A7W8JAU8_9BACT|nr:hypothetical protein [Edaphobacter lichenicola]MBB5345900.1 hypothetical protein [Edaphobacter lichenicola]